MLAVVRIEEPNRSDVTGTYPPLPQLVGGGASCVIPSIDGGAAREQGKIPVPRRTIVGERIEARVTCQVAGLQGDGTAGRIPNEVGTQRGDRPRAIALCIEREDGVLHL